MAKFCLLAEMILPDYFVKKMKVDAERVVCLHGMCKKHVKKSWGSMLTCSTKDEHENDLCENKKLGNNLQLVQDHLEKTFVDEYKESELCAI